MTTKTLTPGDLDARLAALEDAMTKAEAEVDTLSLPAAGGDASSIEKLAKAQSKTVSLSKDREILMRARSQAVLQAEAVSEAEAEALRQAAHERAVGHAKAIFQMANRIDALADEFRGIVAEMPKIEHELWQALRDAGSEATDGTIGRRHIANHAIAAVTSATAPAAMRPRPCASVAGVAWNHLLNEAGEDI